MFIVISGYYMMLVCCVAETISTRSLWLSGTRQ